MGAIADKTTAEDTTLGTFSFSASDAEGASLPLSLTAVSANQSLVLDSSIHVQPSGAGTAQLWLKPQPNAYGTTQITVKVGDGSSETWRVIMEDAVSTVDQTQPGIYDVRSGSDQKSLEGTPYPEW